MRHLFSSLFLLLLLAACAAPVKEPQPVDSSQVARAFAEGDYSAAAEGYARLAAASRGREASQYRLRAAEAWYLGGYDEQARQELARMQGPYPPHLAMARQLLRAKLALVEHPEQALNLLLTPAAGPSEASDLYADFHRLRAEAFGRQGHYLESAREYHNREAYLRDAADIQGNRLAIWEALSLLSDRVLEQLSVGPPDPFSGWMELVRITRSLRQQPDRFSAAVARWQQDYPGHPAAEGFIEEVNQRLTTLVQQPQHLALLLPLSGRFAAAGNALLDGVMAAYYRYPLREQLRVVAYDTGANPKAILDHYQQAVDEGAEFIIGPLDKEAVSLLARMPELPVPLLALNYGDTALSSNMFQFGLAPEEEAAQVAERAWFEGHQSAAMILPEGEWGERVGEAFASRWLEQGGSVVSQVRYNSRANDFSTPLKQLFNLDRSGARKWRISRHFVERIEFTPRRRQDIDFVFVAAFPQQARLLRPQLRFHHAADLPVYATSHVFSGEVDRAKDRDMDGIAFGAMPWTLDAATTHQQLRRADKPQLTRHAGPLQRLVALGVDAFHLTPLLDLLAHYPHERYQGETGSLGLDGQRRIRRELLWATFRGGVPRLQEMPRTPEPEQEPEASAEPGLNGPR